MTTLIAIDPKRWTEGFQDAYAGHAARVLLSSDRSYLAGRAEGEALRQRHQREFEQHLFEGQRMRPAPDEWA